MATSPSGPTPSIAPDRRMMKSQTSSRPPPVRRGDREVDVGTVQLEGGVGFLGGWVVVPGVRSSSDHRVDNDEISDGPWGPEYSTTNMSECLSSPIFSSQSLNPQPHRTWRVGEAQGGGVHQQLCRVSSRCA